MRYLDITSPDIENGLGFRVSLWISGCSCHCPGCHNPESHDFLAGKEWDENAWAELVSKLDKPYIKGLTFTGGNPIESPEGVIEVAEKVKQCFGDTKDIWLFSGYTLEEIQASESMSKVLDYIDYLIDGRFVKKLRDTVGCAFRGSTNQKVYKKNEEGEFVEIYLK